MMRTILTATAAAALALAASPAVAADAPPRSVAPSPKAKPATAVPNPKKPDMSPEQAFELMSRVMDKMLPAGPKPDPMRLAAARSSVAIMMPEGMIANETDKFVETMSTHLLSMSEADFVAMIPEAAGKRKTAPSTVPLREMAAKEVPDFDRKLAESKVILKRMLIKLGAVVEPPLREGLAHSLARDFTGPQLAEINGFLKTPTGTAFGKSATLMWYDREVMRAWFKMYPELIKMAPSMMPDAMALAMLFETPKKAPAAPPVATTPPAK